MEGERDGRQERDEWDESSGSQAYDHSRTTRGLAARARRTAAAIAMMTDGTGGIWKNAVPLWGDFVVRGRMRG